MICDQCKQDKPDVRNRPDPYRADIYCEIVLRDLCDDCNTLLCDEC